MAKEGNLSSRSNIPEDFVISKTVIQIYIWFVYTILCQAINIFGIVTNILNIVCFLQQGLKESVNVSLLGMR